MIHTDISTAMTLREAKTLYDLAQGKRVLEVGALLGYSTCVLAQTASRVYSCDPHDGYPRHTPRPTLNQFKDNIRRYGFEERVYPLIGRAQEMLPKLEAIPDMTFIDTTGRYDDTMYCMEHCNSKVIAVHDMYRGGCEGATQAVLDFVKKHNRTLEVLDTLAVIR